MGLEKVVYEQGVISGGMKAQEDIPAGVSLLAACGSGSQDAVDRAGISIVKASRIQKGPTKPRLVLGPFRFVNHDCDPNCQVSHPLFHPRLDEAHPLQMKPIKGTHAFIIYTIRAIKNDESITIKYTEDGRSFFGSSQCRCSTCVGRDIRAEKRRREEPETDALAKRTRRCGRRERKRKEGKS
jgi:hypothetical protein